MLLADTWRDKKRKTLNRSKTTDFLIYSLAQKTEYERGKLLIFV